MKFIDFFWENLVILLDGLLMYLHENLKNKLLNTPKKVEKIQIKKNYQFFEDFDPQNIEN